MSHAGLPSASTPRPRTYLVSGVLGVVFFTLSWTWWDRGQSFLGSFFLELGGGAFIVFLLEVHVPSALGYAGTALAALSVTTLLEWSDEAVEALVADTRDDAEQARLLGEVERGPFPARRSLLRGVTDTGELRAGRRVLSRVLPPGHTAIHYYVAERARRRRVVVIVGLRRLRARDG